MSPSTRTTLAAAARRCSAGTAVGIIALAGISGCSVINKVNSIRHTLQSNQAAIDSLSQGLKNSKATPFEVTYVTTGSSPTTVTYAVRPPKDIAFKETSGGGGAADVNLIANSSGEFSCTQATSGGQWTCQKLGSASATAQNALFAIYTPEHWVGFLDVFAAAAGLAGDHVTTSSMTVNGFNLHCVDFTAKGVAGTSKICTTQANILGYVKVAQQSTSFEIKSYTASPPSSAFQLPAGAITNLKQ